MIEDPPDDKPKRDEVIDHEDDKPVAEPTNDDVEEEGS